jgi:biopolymer transport protein ExbD
MPRFRKKVGKKVGALSTASLPDIIFMLLFFFMVTTVMRETTLIVKVRLPDATEIQKLERKSLVSYIYIGPPLRSEYGTESRIQLNDRFATNVNEVQSFIVTEREARDEADRPLLTTSLKVDEEVRMGIVTDVKQELRQVGAFRINYSTRRRVEN